MMWKTYLGKAQAVNTTFPVIVSCPNAALRSHVPLNKVQLSVLCSLLEETQKQGPNAVGCQ